VKKNPVKRRMDALEKAQKDGMMRIAQDVIDTRRAVDVLLGALEELDVAMGALRQTVIAAELITEDELDARVVEVKKKKQEVAEAQRERQRQVDDLARSWMAEGMPREEVIAVFREAQEKGLEPEQARMLRAAQRAGKETIYPAGAQIFGG